MGLKQVPIAESYIRDYERLLCGGIWCIVQMEYYYDLEKFRLQKEVIMKLYVARHGQTTWNAQNKVCGITDVELTGKGIE